MPLILFSHVDILGIFVSSLVILGSKTDKAFSCIDVFFSSVSIRGNSTRSLSICFCRNGMSFSIGSKRGIFDSNFDTRTFVASTSVILATPLSVVPSP